MSKLRALSGATWIRPEYSISRGTMWQWRSVAPAVAAVKYEPFLDDAAIPPAKTSEVARLYAHRGEAR